MLDNFDPQEKKKGNPDFYRFAAVGTGIRGNT